MLLIIDLHLIKKMSTYGYFSMSTLEDSKKSHKKFVRGQSAKKKNKFSLKILRRYIQPPRLLIVKINF